MEEMTLRVPVAVKAKVTEDLKAKIVSDLETRLDMVNKDLEAIEFQAQRILADAAKVDATSLTAIRQQIDEEKNKRLAFKEEVTAKLKDAKELSLGTEIPQGTLEQTVTVKIGDNLDALMGAEILLEDGKIVALAKDGSVVLDVKDSKAKAKTAYNNVAIYNDKGEVAQTITAQDNSVVITAGDKTETIDNAAIVLKDSAKKKVNLSMVHVIQIFMLLAGALIVIFTKTDAGKISKNEIFRSGMIALVAVFGISWMAETMFTVHTPMMKAALGDVVKAHPWTYAVMLLLISKFVNSQAAALVAFVPLALGIGVDPAIILAFASACYGYYILPTYPSDLAAIQFDRSGTTHIGKFVINHSFILPGLIGVITSCIFGYIFTSLFGYL